jgi:AbiV family abortive infection protein
VSRRSKAPQHYRGPLTPEQVADGIRLCEKNAASLLAEADLLFQNGRWARTVVLSILAIEEQAKGLNLFPLARTSNPYVTAYFWDRDVRNHFSKVFIGDWVLNGPDRDRVDFDAPLKILPAHSKGEYERLKQRALYVEFSEKRNEWTDPASEITKANAHGMLELARRAAATLPFPFRSRVFTRDFVENVFPLLGEEIPSGMVFRGIADCLRRALERGDLDKNESSEVQTAVDSIERHLAESGPVPAKKA